ncbi:unnamed protein product [Haemonchus placei]|uniref:Transmembrane protein n=1 Tax=Haemonchus placei TaxID=6290 RepID=A0A0N4WWE4_HAEPC|nr:unnamed protein product [Haemonchus placei]
MKPLVWSDDSALISFSTLFYVLMEASEINDLSNQYNIDYAETFWSIDCFQQAMLTNGGQRKRVPSDVDSIPSDSEITVIERYVTSSSPSQSTSNYSDQCDRLRERLEQALVEREKLELQNEQLLKQWEEALEYVTTVQKQLQEEIRRNTDLKNAQMEMEKCRNDQITISRTTLNFIVLLAVFIAFYLYRI